MRTRRRRQQSNVQTLHKTPPLEVISARRSDPRQFILQRTPLQSLRQATGLETLHDSGQVMHVQSLVGNRATAALLRRELSSVPLVAQAPAPLRYESGHRSSSPHLIQRCANKAFDQTTSGKDHDYPKHYLHLVKESTQRNQPVAYIVNMILSYKEVGSIAAVLQALVKGLDMRGNQFGTRVAVVLGINAPVSEVQALAKAIQQAKEIIGKCPFPVAIVSSTFKGKFPYGTMRNQVMHSTKTRALTNAFAQRGLHPYISIQDFDTGSRLMPGQFFPDHIFEGVEKKLYRGPRPLMIAGGYRPGSDLVERTIGRFHEKSEKVPNELGLFNQADFSAKFKSHVLEDMRHRQVYGKIHPLLPYAPEPNLFLDALAVAYGKDSGVKLEFGAGAAEYTQLAKLLGQLEKAELEAIYKPQYEKAPAKKDVSPSLLEKTWTKEKIKARLLEDAQHNLHPFRGSSFLVDFPGMSVETDLSRLAYSYLKKGKDPQSHIGLTTIADRFFHTKSDKKGTSMSTYRKEFKKFSDEKKIKYMIEEVNDEKSTTLTSGMMKSLPGRRNTLSSAISSPLSGPFKGISTGMQSHEKSGLFGFTSLAVPLEIKYLSSLLEAALLQVSNHTPMDGNCLYHAVEGALEGKMSLERAIAMRERVVEWVLKEQNLRQVSTYAFTHGVDINDLILTISTTGNWSGDAGDLVPRIVASALQINIAVHTGSQVHTLRPLFGQSQRTIHITLSHSHYDLYDAEEDVRLYGPFKKRKQEARAAVTKKEYSAIYFDGKVHHQVDIPVGTRLTVTQEPASHRPQNFVYARVESKGPLHGKVVRFTLKKVGMLFGRFD